jgi:hypothetical protein
MGGILYFELHAEYSFPGEALGQLDAEPIYPFAARRRIGRQPPVEIWQSH